MIARDSNLLIGDISSGIKSQVLNGRALLQNSEAGLALERQGQEAARTSAIDSFWAQQDLKDEIGQRMGDLSDQFAATGERLEGIPRQTMDLSEFMRSRIVDPKIMAVLSAKGALVHRLSRFNLHKLPSWQRVPILYYLGDREGFADAIRWHRKLILTGQENQAHTFFDTYESDCPENERQFLEQMRQIENNPPEAFMGHLVTLAKHGVLDRDLHFKLAQMPGGDMFRFGLAGLNMGMTDINRGIRNVDTGIQDGNMQRGFMIRQGIKAEERREAIEKINRAILMFAGRAEGDRGQIATATKKTADNTGVLVEQGIDANKRGAIIQRLQELKLVLEEEAVRDGKGILRASENTAENTSLMLRKQDALQKVQEAKFILEEVAGVDRKGILEASRHTATNTSTLVRQGEALVLIGGALAIYADKAESDRGEIIKSTTRTADNTGIIVNQGFASAIEQRLTREFGQVTAQKTTELVEQGYAAAIEQRATTEFSGITARNTTIRVEQEEQAQLVRVAALGEIERLRADVNFQGEQTIGLLDNLVGATIQIGMSQEQMVGIMSDIANQLPEQFRNISNLLEQVILAIEKTSKRVEQSIEKNRTDTVAAIQGMQTSIETGQAKQEFRDKNKLQMAANSFYESGLIEAKKGNREKALDLFNEAEKLYGGDPRLYFQRGICHISLDHFAQAEEDLIIALKLTPEEEVERRAVILHNMARLYYSAYLVLKAEGKDEESLSQLAQAVSTAREVTKVIPESYDAKLNLAGYLSVSGEQKEAFGMVIDLMQYNPKYIEQVRKSEMFGEIKPHLKNIFEAPAESDKTTLTLALIKDILAFGDEEIAQAYFVELLQKDPANLNRIRFWEIEEFKELLPSAKEYLLQEIVSPSKKGNPDYWYGISSMVLHLDNKLRTRIYKAFCNGAYLDSDFEKQDVEAIKTKIRDIFGNKCDVIISILKTRDPIIFPWLINKL